MIEIMIAAFLGLIVIGGLALFFVKGNDATLGSQRESALIEAANQNLEAIRQQVKVNGFGNLAMPAAPPKAASGTVAYSSATPLDPDSYVVTCTAGSTTAAAFAIERNYDNAPAPFTAADLVSPAPPVEAPCSLGGEEPLLVSSTALSAISNNSSPTQVTIGGQTVTLYDFVTQTNVGCNTNFGACTNDARRVVVAAVDSRAAAACNSKTINTANRCGIGANSPVYLTSIFTNPTPTNSPSSSAGLTLGVQLG